MYSRLELFGIGFALGVFTSIIGPLVFNHFYFGKLDKEKVEYNFIDKRASVWGGIFGTVFTAVIVSLVFNL